jgi:hypothetical protein
MTLYNLRFFPVKLSGHRLARNPYSPSQLAALAASVILGEVEYFNPTHIQIAKAFGASRAYVQKALTLSPEQRAAMRDGLLDMAAIPPTTSELDRVVGLAGTEPSWQAIVKHLDEQSEIEPVALDSE